MTGNVYEVFSGIQGEGLYVGERHIFVRFVGCNIACRFCDTPASRMQTPTCSIEREPGSRSFVTLANPVPADVLVEQIFALETFPGLHGAVAVTGGEPLCQPDMFRAVAAGLREKGMRVLLETNGTLPDEMAKVADFVDVVSMDVKLPSATGEKSYLAAHAEFLRAVKSVVYVKIVVASTTPDEELSAAATMIASVDQEIPLILQPASPQNGVEPPSAERVLSLQASASKRLASVRVIPQCHKFMGQM